MNACLFSIVTTAILAGCAAVAAPTGIPEEDEGQIVISGNLTVLQALESHLPRLERSAVKAVVFQDCFGGQIGGVDAISEVIRRRGLRTQARGTVASGCALAFLAADRRSLSRDPSVNTKLVLHGTYTVGENGSRELSKTDIEELSAYINSRTRGRISNAIAIHIASIPDYRDGLTVYANSIEFEGVSANVVLCDRVRPLKGKPCTVLTGADALSLGLEMPE